MNWRSAGTNILFAAAALVAGQACAQSYDNPSDEWLTGELIETVVVPPPDAIQAIDGFETIPPGETAEASLPAPGSIAGRLSEELRQYGESSNQASSVPIGYRPWWEPAVLAPLDLSPRSIPVTTDSLVLDALQYSNRIAALNENITIAQTGIVRAAAEFDPKAFTESRFVRTSVPTGSSLDAGANVNRLREEDFTASAGMRRKTEAGGRFELGQQIGLRNSNSVFFTPGNQGNSRLSLSFNQPLLAGAGTAVNRSLIVLAQLDTQIAQQKTTTGIQNHLLSVTEVMWELFFQRAVLMLRLRHLEKATAIGDWLENRRDLDSLESQVLRARAAVTQRRSELVRAVTSIKNLEDRLRAIVNSPELLQDRDVELVPAEAPVTQLLPVSFDDAIVTALQQRSEINEVAGEIESTRVRLNVARNEMLPALDLVLESYVSGLRGSNNIGQSWVDQFSVGEPSYTAGLIFEVPLWRRAAKANVQRRRAELRQLTNQLEETIQQIHSDVAAAAREVQTSYREMGAKYASMNSAAEYVRLLERRWKELPGEGYTANSILEDLLDAQDRLLNEQTEFARSRVEYTLSTIRLKRATGSLLQIQPLTR
ncbi:TolC family protein [Roseiconus nitratireducens]|uniref:TolC family protein n=1 Tax=Roseiconus nitratireducens TaxID=2605748 RepID=A0A5M6CX28_9BACT|nr:TolC family protein [Roseiconus nitratireducens]KAA5538542.1 TolC family protein [Roseiconus nitratireducens]